MKKVFEYIFSKLPGDRTKIIEYIIKKGFQNISEDYLTIVQILKNAGKGDQR